MGFVRRCHPEVAREEMEHGVPMAGRYWLCPTASSRGDEGGDGGRGAGRGEVVLHPPPESDLWNCVQHLYSIRICEGGGTITYLIRYLSPRGHVTLLLNFPW